MAKTGIVIFLLSIPAFLLGQTINSNDEEIFDSLPNDWGELFQKGYEHFIAYEYIDAIPYFEKAAWWGSCSGWKEDTNGNRIHTIEGEINSGHPVIVNWIDTKMDYPKLGDELISYYSKYYLTLIYNGLGYYTNSIESGFFDGYWYSSYSTEFDFTLQTAISYFGKGYTGTAHEFFNVYKDVPCSNDSDKICSEVTGLMEAPSKNHLVKMNQLQAKSMLLKGEIDSAITILSRLEETLNLIDRRTIFIDLSLSKSELSASNNNLLGEAYLSKGEKQLAIDHLKKVIAISKNPFVKADAKVRLASIYKQDGNDTKTIKYLKEGVELFDKFGGKSPANNILHSLTLGRMYLDAGNTEKGMIIYRVLKPVIWKQIRSNISSLSENEQLIFLDNYKHILQEYIYFVTNYGNSDPQLLSDLFDLVAEIKGLVLKTINQIDEIAPLIYEKNDYRIGTSPYDSYLLSKDSLLTLPENSESYTLLKEEIQRKESSIIQDIANSGFTNNDSVSWRNIRDRLLPNEVAVEIVRNQIGEEINYFALIITDRTVKAPKLISFTNGEFLENEGIRRYKNGIQFKISEYESYDLFWSPIKEAIGTINKVYLSPDGVFNSINFNTLQNKANGKYLIDEVELEIKSSTREIRKPPLAYETGKPVLFGFPDYSLATAENSDQRKLNTDKLYSEISSDTSSRFFDTRTGKVNPLPGTLQEVQSISEYIEGPNLKYGREKSLEYTRHQATEKTMRELISPQFLHIATHGFFLKDSDNYLDKDPMSRSGLLLAGCESILTGQTNEAISSLNDGILTAKEAQELNLTGTELVVLSACETGLGVIRNGEGVFGLQRAFQLAGARSIIYSLWKVNDETTSLLMTKFYESYLSGSSIPEAFTLAQNYVRNDFPQPFYWGPFVLVIFN